MKRKLVAILLAVSFIFSTAPAVFAAPIKIGISICKVSNLSVRKKLCTRTLAGNLSLRSVIPNVSSKYHQ